MDKNTSKLLPLTEEQFHTVWTEAVGRPGYDKTLFKETFASLHEQGLISDNSTYKGWLIAITLINIVTLFIHLFIISN